ncbi:MAG: hypothetical protein ACRD16_01155 [Thermoanaerobaculia bacterium]
MSAQDARTQIEKEVKRRLEEHFDQLREEFERMRIESHRKWEEFLMRLDFPLPELVPAELIPAPGPSVSEAGDLSDLREFARSIDAATTQVDALKAFLGACTRRSQRAVLLVARGEALAVWKSEGFTAADEASLRTISVSPSAHPALEAAMAGEPVALSSGSPVAALLSVGEPLESLLVPIVVREKISALLYADRLGNEFSFDPDALALFSYLIGIAVDRLGSRKVQPAPSLLPIRRWQGETPARELELPAEPPAAVPPPPATGPAAAPRGAPRAMDLESTGRAYRPPSGIAPGGAGILRGLPDEEDPHESAKKIARLLVSDIRLYNEAAIEEGKKHNDIYSRLKDDIDRARQAYEERVPEAVRRSTNYFFDELIRSLADGSPQAFGS